MLKIIDLRSDTVTLQPVAMKKKMLNADVGDEYYGEDPSVIQIQEYAAKIFDKEAALFTGSGTMGNLVSILTHTNKSEMVIMESESHSYKSEVSNISVVAGVLPKLVKGHNGVMDPKEIEKSIPTKAWAFPEVSLLLIENTHNAAGGICVTPKYMAEYRKIADKYNVKIHVDGARIFNASISLGVDVRELAKDADSLSFCLSKGLSCPFGGLIVGTKEFVLKARKYQQMIGGGFRQIGYMASAGIYALKNMIYRLEDDHNNAKLLAIGLNKLGMFVNMDNVQTNFVNVEIPFSKKLANKFVHSLNSFNNIKINNLNNKKLRLVTHYGISTVDVNYFLSKANKVLKKFNVSK